MNARGLVLGRHTSTSTTRPAIGIREYICHLQRMLSLYLREVHGLTPTTLSELTGVFLGEKEKVASIGVQVRHRLTTHGFAMNVPLPSRLANRL